MTPKIQIEVVLGNGLGPHGNGTVATFPIGHGHTDTMYTSKPIGFGTMSMPERGDRNNALDSSFMVRRNVYSVEFQKYFTVKNLKVLLEKQVPRFPHQQQRLFLKGQLLDDCKELAEYGITAATSSKMRLTLMLVPDVAPSAPWMLPARRRDEDGSRTWKPAVNPTGIVGRDFATRLTAYMP